MATDYEQVFIDAQEDAISLSEFMYKPADYMVKRRLAPPIHTLEFYIDEATGKVFEKGGLPAKPFATKTLMEASALVDSDYAYVTDDTVNNGLYLKTAGVWVKSEYDPLRLSYTQSLKGDMQLAFELLQGSNNIFNPDKLTKGFFISGQLEGEILESTQGLSYSDYIPVYEGAEYTLSGGNADTKPFEHIAYYDKDKEFIARIDATATYNKPQTIKVPDGVFFMRLNIRLNTSGELVGQRMINKGRTALPHEDYKLPILPDATVTTETAKRAYDSLINSGELYDFSGKHLQIPNNLYDYRTATKGAFISGIDGSIGENSSYILSDYIEIKPSESFLFTGGSDNSRAFIHTAFFDEGKNFLLRRNTGAYGDSSMRVTAPANAHYMRVNMQGGAPDSFERMIVRGFERLPYDDGEIKLKDIELSNEMLNRVSDYLDMDTNGRFGDSLIFTADKYPAVVFDFNDSYSKDDEINISAGNDSMTNERIEQWWDSLVIEFPDYVTKTQVGYDSSGEYPVYSYQFKPSKAYNMDANLKEQQMPRVFLMAQHDEQLNMVYPYLMMRDICKNWQSNPALSALRHQVEFLVMPNVHPWGIANGEYRTTSEGLNVNSDYPFNWQSGASGLPNGEAPFATAEARNVRDVVEPFKPHVFIDMHSNFASAIGSGVWIPSSDTGRLKTSAINAVTDMYGAFTLKDPDAPPINQLIKFTFSDPSSTARGYGYMLKTTGGTFEVAKNYKNRPYGDGLYNDGLIFATSAFVNTVIQCIADYRDNGYPFRDGYGEIWKP